jgi:hypothetical protein
VRTFVVSSKLTAYGAVLLTLTLVTVAWTVSGQQVKRSSVSDAPRIRATPPAGAAALAARQRFLEMFARAYFPGRTGQLLVVPREGDFITRPDSDVAYMHGSPWEYDVSIPLMFVGPAVRTGRYSMPAVQQDVAPTLAAALGVQMLPTVTGRVLPVLRTDFARPRVVMLVVLDGMRRDYFDRYAASMPTLTALAASAAPSSLMQRLTFSRRTHLLGTPRSRREPILACTESQASACTTARTAGVTTYLLKECRKI